jgi:hypothetical protein
VSRAASIRAKVETYLGRQGRAGNQLHGIWIVENPTPTEDSTTGLPHFSGSPTVTQLIPMPRVRLGGKEVPVAGGALEVLGDARVEHISRTDWPQARLLAAAGFRIDDPSTGDLYQVLAGSIKEMGPATYSLLLKRVSQPRS